MQFVAACLYLGATYLRVRAKQQEINETSVLKEVLSLIILSLLLSSTVGVVITYRLDQQQRSSPECAGGDWRTSLWLSTFRWTLAVFGPLGLVALPSIVQLCRLRRKLGSQLKSYLTLTVLVLFTNCLMNAPSLVSELSHWVEVAKAVEEDVQERLDPGSEPVFIQGPISHDSFFYQNFHTCAYRKVQNRVFPNRIAQMHSLALWAKESTRVL